VCFAQKWVGFTCSADAMHRRKGEGSRTPRGSFDYDYDDEDDNQSG
jgi:hypothetical protein